jgi:glucose dehydrogenase
LRLTSVVPVLAWVVWMAVAAAAQKAAPLVEWPHYGGDQGGTKYPPLTQIIRDNVTRLQVAWEWLPASHVSCLVGV